MSIESSEIAHAIDLERTAMGIASSVKAPLDNIADYVRLILTRYAENHGDKIRTIKDRNELIKQISEYMTSYLGEWTDELTEELEAVVANELKFQNAVIRNVTGASVVVPTLEQSMTLIKQMPLVLNDIAFSWDDYIKQYAPNQVQAVKQKIIAGWADGLTTREISQSIVGTKKVKGTLQKSLISAQMMVKDLCSHQSSETKAEFGKRNNDIVVGEKVIVTLDSRTSPVCQRYGSQDKGGKEFYYKDGRNFPRPPFHRQCRSTMTYILSPEYREKEESRMRPAVVNGKAIQVRADTNYLDFAKAYPSVAESALGKTKAKLIDNMSADEFRKAAYNRLGEPMTLKEMAESSKKIAKQLKES